MEELFSTLVSSILEAGKPGFVGLLLLITSGMGWYTFKREVESKKERRELIDQFQKMIEHDRQDLLLVIDKFQHGQISMIQAIDEIKLITSVIGAKLEAREKDK